VAFVDLGHSEIAYRKVGQGPPLVLVHGYPLSGLTFRHIAPRLGARFTCYMPDLPGLGESRCTDLTDFNFAGQAETLKQFVDKLGLTSYALLGHDTGGTIARRLATTDSERVEKLVLIGTEIPEHRPPWIEFFQRLSNPKRTGTFKFLMRSRAFRRSNAAFGGCFTDLSLIDGDFHKLFVAPLLASDEKISKQIRYLRGIDWKLVDGMKTEHARIPAPTLLIWGEDDPIFPVARARIIAEQLPNCAGLVTVPGAKLFVHEEKPDRVAELALNFLTAAGEGRAS
jgi:pimeloyl-ACP methyl ester carboxylesterase